jgi:hypothetical protein
MIDFPASPTNGQVFISGAQSWTWDGVKWVPSGTTVMPPLATGDNRLINGDMRIDQRNNGASGTATGVYTVDRWAYSASQASKGTWQRWNGASLPGFPYALNFISSSAYASAAGDNFGFYQRIEADMVSDFAWGASSAQPATLSFWVFSTLTGTFSGAIQNLPAPGTRSFPFTYSIPVASTWTKIAITIPGDTAGTWVMNGNAGGVSLIFDLGSGSTLRGPANAWASGNYWGATGSVSIVGTNAASFYVTGVKLEIGSIATPFNRQSLAKSLADCQRYYVQPAIPLSLGGNAGGANQTIFVSWSAPVTLRAAPTVVAPWGSGGNAVGNAISVLADNRTIQSSISSQAAGQFSAILTITSLSAEL